MKRLTFVTILALSALVLSACGVAGNSATSAGSGFRGASAFRNRPLTPEAKLALGTIKLEGTSLAIDPSEAAKLLPLWQLMAQLNGSSSTAPQEVAAVMDQIQATMTVDQVKAVGSMQLTSADIASVFQQQAAQAGASASGASRNSGGQRGGGGVFFGGGGFPGGGGFGGANRAGAGANGSTTTASAAQSAQQASNQISLILVNQVVQLLESRIKS